MKSRNAQKINEKLGIFLKPHMEKAGNMIHLSLGYSSLSCN